MLGCIMEKREEEKEAYRDLIKQMVDSIEEVEVLGYFYHYMREKIKTEE